MDLDTMVVDPSLEGVRESAFTLHPSSGVLSLNMNPLDTMVGMFEFDVVATDTSTYKCNYFYFYPLLL